MRKIAPLSLKYAGGAQVGIGAGTGRYVGRRAGRPSLAQVGPLAGAVEYAAAAGALTRFGRRMEPTPELRQKIARIQE
jgi:hypothetical protein